jgi:energy-coupling factor transport system ATP-binding protein
MQEDLITFTDFSFTYKGQTEATLHHINLRIRKGEKILVAGPSGSGKSTLGYAVNALIPHAYSGKVEGRDVVCGLDIQHSDIYAVNKKVGTVMQDTDAQFVALSSAEDIAFSLENQCMDQQDMQRLVTSMARIVDMEAFLSHSPQDLSGGQKQRVSLAGVLVDDVDVLLFDEPLANLDPETGRTAIALIDELAKTTDKTIIIIEHRLEDVLSCPVDRILVMQEGCLVSDTSPAELLGSSLLPSLGIRDPLYLGALRLAGCDLSTLGDVSDLKSMSVERCAAQLSAWHTKSRVEHPRAERAVQLRFNGLSYSYDGMTPVLQGLDATIHEGEMVSILGSNGAGKSTLAQLLMGVLKQDSGDIFFEEHLINDYSASQRSSMIGFVMQNPNHMISCDLVYDEVAFALRQKGYPEAQIKDRVMDVLGLCALRPYHHWPISALSYGQKKRVTIASILVTQPKVLILDEPTSGQDYQRYTTLMEFLSHLNRTIGLTILFITHDMHLALEYTHRSLVLHQGVLLCDKPTGEVFSDEAVLKQANLKVTSLYTLAKRCGIEDIPSFIETFVETEAKTRVASADARPIPWEEQARFTAELKQKPKKRVQKGGRKFGFTLTYEDTASALHALNGVTKLGVFLLWIMFSLTTFDLRFLAFGTAFSFICLLASKIPLLKFKPYFIGMGTVIALNALFIYLFSPDQGTLYLGSRTVLLGSEGATYALTRETLFYLVVVCLKYFSIFPMALLFVSITNPSQFASSLNRLGLSYKISYAVALALRYLPEVSSSYLHILHAQMARGVDISRNVSLGKRLSSVSRLLAPLVLSSLDRIEVITNAMILRGFGRMDTRTWYLSQKLRVQDYLVLGFAFALVAASLWVRFWMNVMFWYPF